MTNSCLCAESVVSSRGGWLSLDNEEIVRRILTYDSRSSEPPAKRVFATPRERQFGKQVARLEVNGDLPIKKRCC